MNTRVCLPVLCFTVIMSAHLTIAIGGFEMELLMTKLDFLQDRLQEVEQTMQTTMEVMDLIAWPIEHRKMSVKNDILLQKMERNLQEKFERHLQTKLHAMEESMKKNMKTSEDNTRAKLEDISNHLVSKMNNILQQQVAETKTFQETSETELKKIDEFKNALGKLSDSVRSINMQAKLNTRLLNSMHKFEVGWTVIQHRFDGSVDFYRNWKEYRNGFGNVDGEFWLGLEIVHQMTKNRPHELLVEVKDFHGNYGYAKYEEFEIGNESEKYVLKKLGTYSGTAGDSMRSNKKFSTFDHDNDQSDNNCAELYHGAWWYWRCTMSNLNGRYQNTTYDASAIEWWYFKRDSRGMSYSRMMIRDRIN